ncbi:DUF6838 family protein [Ornithinibacillus sp. 4-3]|uniref:DUF6838 family protein n=1 Tax=Ornithinibacillus sp. 4-3 TaxID=3231488 RepID=A0AB39HMA3_9BACI
MNQEIGSIMAYMYSLFPVQIYDKELPQEFEVPSMYFPLPTSFGSNDTNQTYLKSYTLNIKVFHDDTNQAYYQAEKLADTIASNREVIPMVDVDGAETGDFIRFNRIETRDGSNGAAMLILNWDSRYYYHRDDVPAIEYVDITSGVK